MFGRSAQCIDWNSPDGMKTRSIFLILTPQGDNDVQVQILRMLSAIISDEKTVSEFLSASTAAKDCGDI